MPINLEGAAVEVFISYKASHHAIVKFEGVYKSPLDSSIRMTMEYMDAGCVRDLMRFRPLDMPRVASVIQDVLSGLEYLHSVGVVHRDIKPDNVMVNRAGAVKIG